MMREGGGWSAIIGPFGNIIEGPHRDDEKMLIADLDLGDIARFKYVSDSAGHYARPDVLRLAVDYRPQSITAPFGEAASPLHLFEEAPDAPAQRRNGKADAE